MDSQSSSNSVDKKLEEFLDTVAPEARNWKPVEFRCMIQDILGNEIYHHHNSDKLGDRTIFYCITIPGENEWVRKVSENGFNNFSSTHELSNGKLDRLSCSLVNYSFPIPSDGKNKSCLIKVYDNNLVEHLRVNDILQVEGLVEPSGFEDDSELFTNKNSPKNLHGGGDLATPNGSGVSAGVPSENNNNTNNSNSNGQNNSNSNNSHRLPPLAIDDSNELDPNNDFEPANDFPHRLVPRVHVRRMKKLNHINPLLPAKITRDLVDLTKVRMARARLSTIINQLFAGDCLATEYFIMSLISGVLRHKDVMTLGQLTIGLSGIKPEMKFLIEKLYEIITKITTHSHYIDMSIANLNNLRFSPHKDFQNNKMIAGTLQLPDGLYLMVDETALSTGQLNQLGTSNLKTLIDIIKLQRHQYNFKFHSVEIDTDLKILVVSESNSILDVPCTIKLDSDDPENVESMRRACESVNDFLTEDLLAIFRYYITALKNVPEYTIPDELKTVIPDDFARVRQEQLKMNGKVGLTEDDLSFNLTLARYLTLSRGDLTLTEETWKEVLQMETARKARLAVR